MVLLAEAVLHCIVMFIKCEQRYSQSLHRMAIGKLLWAACLPDAVADSRCALMPGADFAEVCTDKGSDLEGDIDLG